MKINIVHDSYDNSTSENEGLSTGRIVEGRNLYKCPLLYLARLDSLLIIYTPAVKTLKTVT